MGTINVATNGDHKSGGCLLVNYPGIGDAIMSYPVISSLSLDSRFAESVITYPNTLLFESSCFNSIFPLPTNYVGFDNSWYEFNEIHWGKINNFIQRWRIDIVINLQNEGPLYDKNYYRFREAHMNQLDFWELDFKSIYSGEQKEHVLESIRKMLESHNVRWWYPTQEILRSVKRRNVTFFLGGSEVNKRWRVEQWIQVIKRLSSKYKNERFVVLAGISETEKEEMDFIRRNIGNIANVSIIGSETLNECLCELRKSKLLISHDTYPIHFASLLSIPVLGIYFSTDPVIWGSYNNNDYRYIASSLSCTGRKQGTGNCSHFHNACPNIKEIKDLVTVAQVIDRSSKLLEDIKS